MPALLSIRSPPWQQPLPHPHVICCSPAPSSSSSPQEQQVPLVDVSLDLMQYMSESFAADEGWVVPTATNQQPHAGATKAGSLAACSSLMGSSCSTHSNQMVPDSPTCSSTSSQQQQQDCDMRGSSCGSDATAAAAPTSSGSGSSSSMMLQRAGSQPHSAAAAGSCLCYDDDFVFQCYYGNPNSPANQQQQRPKQHSPFAAYASFPGFSL